MKRSTSGSKASFAKQRRDPRCNDDHHAVNRQRFRRAGRRGNGTGSCAGKAAKLILRYVLSCLMTINIMTDILIAIREDISSFRAAVDKRV